MLHYNTDEKNIYINVPYLLKDIFKKNFKTAKWDRHNKEWHIKNNQKNLNKIKSFIKKIDSKNIINKIDELEEQELTEEEINNINFEINELKEEIEKRSKSLEEIKKIKLDLILDKENLKKLHEENQKQKDSLEKEFESIKKIALKIIDYDEIEKAYNRMLALHMMSKNNFLYAAEKKDFINQQNIIKKAIDDLRKKGYFSKTLNDLYWINVNRLDKNELDYLNIQNVFLIKKLSTNHINRG